MTESLKSDFIAMVEILEKTRKEITQLKEQNEELEKRNLTYKKQIDTLKAKIEGIGLSNSLGGEPSKGDTAQAKERIDSLCKQIQDCISLLKQ